MNGMDDNDDDDNFSDGAFDELAPNTLLELEQNALQATQKPHGVDESHDHHVHPLRRQTLPQFRPHVIQQESANGEHSHQAQNLHDPEYVEDAYDQDVWDDGANIATPKEEKDSLIPPKEPYSEAVQREQWRINRFGQANPSISNIQRRAVNPDTPQIALRPPAINDSRQHSGASLERQSRTIISQNDGDCMLLDGHTSRKAERGAIEEEALRAQIEDLLRDREALTKELHAANDAVTKHKGEISIIRSNQGKSSKTFDRQLAALKKSIEEDTFRHRAELEAVNAESKRIVNDNQFLRHNLSEEVERTRSLQRKIKDKTGENRSPATTPKRNRTLPLRDGFNDQELTTRSPVKGGKKPVSISPSVGNKRKRKPTADSPAPALELSPGIINVPDEPVPQAETEKTTVSKTVILQDNKSLDFMQKVLNHRIGSSRQRMLELFTNYAFPSEGSKPFSTIFFERTAGLSGASLPVDLTKVIISLWSHSINEKYYQPLPVFTDMIGFILALDTVAIAPFVIEEIVKVLERTVELNGIPRFKHSPVSHLAFGKSKPTPQSELVDVDETACLDMLYITACACSHTPKHLAHFWQTVSSDFILMMLNSSQLIPNITLTLALLSTSILPNTFGTIVATETDQATIEKYILDRITYLLWETPRTDEGSLPYTRSEICTLRLTAMSLLSTLALSSPHPHSTPTHSTLLLAHHPTALARIFRSMYDELDLLSTHPASHASHASLVNLGTRTVHHLLRLHRADIDLSQKLASINGGIQKHRVVLTRLAFSEGLVLEAGIEDETVLMAHEMLEESVTPEEAEALMDVFPAAEGVGKSQKEEQ